MTLHNPCQHHAARYAAQRAATSPSEPVGNPDDSVTDVTYSVGDRPSVNPAASEAPLEEEDDATPAPPKKTRAKKTQVESVEEVDSDD